MSVRSFQQIVDDAERLKPYKARYIGNALDLGFTAGKVYEVKDDPANVLFDNPDMHYVELVDDDGYDRCRPYDEFEKIPATLHFYEVEDDAGYDFYEVE